MADRAEQVLIRASCCPWQCGALLRARPQASSIRRLESRTANFYAADRSRMSKWAGGGLRADLVEWRRRLDQLRSKLLGPIAASARANRRLCALSEAEDGEPHPLIFNMAEFLYPIVTSFTTFSWWSRRYRFDLGIIATRLLDHKYLVALLSACPRSRWMGKVSRLRPPDSFAVIAKIEAFTLRIRQIAKAIWQGNRTSWRTGAAVPAGGF
jgi:hypothetical protein